MDAGSDRCHAHRRIREWLAGLDDAAVWRALARSQREVAELARCGAALAALLASAERKTPVPDSMPIPCCHFHATGGDRRSSCGGDPAPAPGTPVPTAVPPPVSPGSLILAHVAALEELAELLSRRLHAEQLRDVAATLRGFVGRLPPADWPEARHA